MVKENYIKKSRGLSLFSGGLDSQLAVKVLQRAGAHVEAITFVTPFFSPDTAIKAAKALGVELHLIDFTNDEIELIKNPPHGFGSAMNPCIDCHATMIKRAGEIMIEKGFDFIATGEVVNQRPMSQNKQAMRTVEKSSGFEGRLVRPLSALLLEPTIPETEGILDRSQLLDLSGRRRERQAELASEFGLVDYPSPGGGCKLTEKGFCKKLKDLMDNEGLDERRLVELLLVGRRFRLPGGSSVILGRELADNKKLESVRTPTDTLLAPVSVPGPTAIIPAVNSPDDIELAARIVCAWSKFDKFKGNAIVVKKLKGDSREDISITPPYSRDNLIQFQIT